MTDTEKFIYLKELEDKVKSTAQFIQDNDWGAAFREVLKSERKRILNSKDFKNQE